jgi:hypothetical protein
MNKLTLWTTNQLKLETNYNNIKINQDENGLTLLFTDDTSTNQPTKLFFGNIIHGYRTFSGTLRIAYLNHLKHNNNFDYRKNSFFKIIDSSYVQLILKEAAGLCDSDKIEHFCFITKSNIVEVASTIAPERVSNV